MPALTLAGRARALEAAREVIVGALSCSCRRGQRWVVEVAVSTLTACLLLLLAMPGLAAARPEAPGSPAQSPTRAATVPPTPVPGDILLSTRAEMDLLVTVTYNDAADKYLAVWVSDTALIAQVLDGGGVPVGEAVEIARVQDWSTQARVAFARGPGRYLVVWSDTGAQGHDVFGQLLTGDGQLTGDRMVICYDPDDQEAPAIAATQSDFLVLWQGIAADGSQDIAGRRVSGTGVIAANVLAVANRGTIPYANPSVAYDFATGSYLVVYEHGEEGIRAQGLQATSGALLGAEMSVSAEYAVGPRIALGWSGPKAVALVTWQDMRAGNWDIYARPLIPGDPPRLGGPEFAVQVAAETQGDPAIAALSADDEFLIIWVDWGLGTPPENDLAGRVVSALRPSPGEPFTVSAAAGEQWFPDLAVAPQSGEAIVVWEDRRTADNQDVYAQRLDQEGGLLSTEQNLSAAPGEQAAPAAAYDRDDDQYLAVWQERRRDSTAIMGQRLTAIGTPLEAPWTIDGDVHENVEPDVAYCPQGRYYQVVWSDTTTGQIESARVPPGGGFILRDVLRDSGGGRRPRVAYDEPNHQFLVIWQAHGDIYANVLEWDTPAQQPSRVTVFAGAGAQEQPAVAVDTTHHQYLAVWRGGTAGAEDIYGTLLDSRGHPLAAAIVLAGGGSDVLPRSAPSVAYDAATDAYLVAYVTAVTAKDGDIRARVVSAAGAPVGQELTVRDQPADADQASPQVTFVPDSGRYHLLWSELAAGTSGSATAVDLYGRWLGPDGRPASPTVAIVRYPGDQRAPRVALDAEHDRTLVVWEDTRSSKIPDVYARIGVLDTLAPTAVLSVDPSVGVVGTTFRLDAHASRDNVTPQGALAVRWDWTSDGTFDTPWSATKVVTRTLRTVGTYTVTVAVRDLAGLTATASRALQVVAGTVNRVPTAVLRVLPESGVAGSAFTFDASASSDPETPAAELEVRWDWDDDGAFDTPWRIDKVEHRALTAAGTQRLRLEVRDEAGLTAAATGSVRVTAGPTARIQVSPGAATLRTGEAVCFFAATWDRYDNPSSNTPVKWALSGPGIGAIDARGVFTAGLRAGTFTDAVRATDGAAKDTASVTIVAPRFALYLPWAVKPN
jgi:hypothetical protein